MSGNIEMRVRIRAAYLARVRFLNIILNTKKYQINRGHYSNSIVHSRANKADHKPNNYIGIELSVHNIKLLQRAIEKRLSRDLNISKNHSRFMPGTTK